MSVNNTGNSTNTEASNLFQDVLNDANAVQNELLGPTYQYYKNIKTPQQIGMSSDGTLNALGDDINGLIQYVSVLVSGKSSASTTGGPLGNKFFLKTGAKCLDAENNEQDRYIYINNVPTGNIPFISSGLGVNFTEFKGLVPGTLGNMNALNPYGIMQAFLSGSTPKCLPLTMEVIDVNNNANIQTNYVTMVDIQNMDPCSFLNNYNPVSGKKCNETFQNMQQKQKQKMSNLKLPQDFATQSFLVGLSGFAIYFLSKLMEK
jgi:hypothetical protein